MLRVAIVLAFASLCWAQRQPCCLPKQWEGIQVELGGRVFNNEGQVIQLSNQIVFDGSNGQVAFMANSSVGGVASRWWIIEDYDKKITYQINLMTKVCKKLELSTDIPSTCLPDDATPMGTLTFGGGSKQLEAELYNVPLHEPTIEASVALTLTRDGDNCYPLSEGIFGTADGNPFVASYGFLNITSGISHPSFFTPPESCDQVPITEVPHAKQRKGVFSTLYF